MFVIEDVNRKPHQLPALGYGFVDRRLGVLCVLLELVFLDQDAPVVRVNEVAGHEAIEGLALSERVRLKVSQKKRDLTYACLPTA